MGQIVRFDGPFSAAVERSLVPGRSRRRARLQGLATEITRSGQRRPASRFRAQSIRLLTSAVRRCRQTQPACVFGSGPGANLREQKDPLETAGLPCSWTLGDTILSPCGPWSTGSCREFRRPNPWWPRSTSRMPTARNKVDNHEPGGSVLHPRSHGRSTQNKRPTKMRCWMHCSVG